MSSSASRYVEVQISDDERLIAYASEAALRDHDLDGLEAQLELERDPGRSAAMALALGRCARASSRLSLERASAALRVSGQEVEGLAVELACDLLSYRPNAERVTRADHGYRYLSASGVDLFVEDPIAARWHRAGRWGPPLRPDLDRTQVLARRGADLDQLFAEVVDGGTVVICFEPPRWLGRPEPPLRLSLAGLARDPSLSSLTRWSRIDSIGRASRWGGKRVAYEVRGDPLEMLPANPILASDALLELMSRLLRHART